MRDYCTRDIIIVPFAFGIRLNRTYNAKRGTEGGIDSDYEKSRLYI